MKVKRMTAALLMAAMTCGVLTGCSQDSKEGEQKLFPAAAVRNRPPTTVWKKW